MKAVFTSHTGWVSAVAWAPHSEHMFVSASHDQLVKLWDARSNRTPLYELTGNLCPSQLCNICLLLSTIT